MLEHKEALLKARAPYDPTTIAVGDTVIRILGRVVEMPLRVTELDDETVTCGWWTFDRATGAEVDEELGWSTEGTGSILKFVTTDGDQ